MRIGSTRSASDYLRRVVRATQRLDRLLNDILELSRAQRMLPPMEEVEAETLVKEALTRLDARIQETGAAVQIISPLPLLRVNRMWATQGLYNLLANAMKFTRDGHAPDIEITSYEAPASTTSRGRNRGEGPRSRGLDAACRTDFHAVSTGGRTERGGNRRRSHHRTSGGRTPRRSSVGPATRRRRIGVRDDLRDVRLTMTMEGHRDMNSIDILCGGGQ